MITKRPIPKNTDEEEQEQITEAIEQEPETIPTTEAHRIMATMIKEYAKEYIDKMDEHQSKDITDNTLINERQTIDIIDNTLINENQNNDITDNIVSISEQYEDKQSDEYEESMTSDMLRSILEQYAISDEDKHRINLYSKRKKNKKKRALIRAIRERFNC